MQRELKVFADPRAFLERVTTFLSFHEAENNLLFGVLSGLIDGGHNFGAPAFLGLVEDNNEIAAVAIRTPSLPLILPVMTSETAIAHLAAALFGRGEQLPGVTGPATEARMFAAKWCALTGLKQQSAGSSRIYRLDKVIPPRRVNGKMRACAEADLALATQWLKAFQPHAVEPEPPGEVVRVFERVLGSNERRLFFWDDERPVSMAGYAGPTPNGIRVNAVYTPPELRGRGYASACVAALSQMLLEQGRKFCFLYTDLTNSTSNHIYQAIGYRWSCDTEVLRFEE